MTNTFSESELQATQAPLKVGLVATVDGAGRPHLSLLSTLMACGETRLAFGQFCEGMSKVHLATNPKIGWLIMSLQKQFWRGQAHFTGTARSGAEYDLYNNVPMFRYNAYFGIHTVYYFDLIQQSGMQVLPMRQVVAAGVATLQARSLSHAPQGQVVLNPWTQAFFNKLDNLKFLAYVRPDGYPEVIPLIQAQAWGKEHLLFSTLAFGAELRAIPAGACTAVFGMSMQMEDVLVRGEYEGIRSVGGMACGVLKVDWVYNSMPPTPGQIYPAVELEAVRW